MVGVYSSRRANLNEENFPYAYDSHTYSAIAHRVSSPSALYKSFPFPRLLIAYLPSSSFSNRSPKPSSMTSLLAFTRLRLRLGSPMLILVLLSTGLSKRMRLILDAKSEEEGEEEELAPLWPLSGASTLVGESSGARRGILKIGGEEVSGDEVGLEGLTEEAEPDEQSNIGERGEPEGEEIVSHDEEAIDLIKVPEEDVVPSQPRASEIAITIPTFYCGLRVPFPPSVRKFLHEISIHPVHLFPSAWQTVLGTYIHWRRENKEEPIVDSLRMTFSLRVLGTLRHYYVYKYKKFNNVAEGLSSPKSWARRLKVQCGMKKSVFSPEHMTAYGLWTDPEAEEEDLKLGAAEKEIQEPKNDYENQLIIRFKPMKEALKVVEPSFMVERLDEVNLESLYPAVIAKVSGASPLDTTPEV
ncbi:hypothetical protein FNV43_RR13009 [Rhamnella rubrinervis]|uniref:Uncharacterized protein n=1 Tax=Rhamnella rubrinervis TaxID=2594499 RepID=A0A8K0H089_9ROSA|nr:hypothetical protein FNV43_RR13009 [Rhamnella rubrinervis]